MSRMDPVRQSDSFPGRYSLAQDVTIEAEGGNEMTFDDSLRSSLGQMGDPMFVSTGRKIRKDIEESLTSSQVSVASMQSTSSLGILQLDSLTDLSTSLLQLDGSINMPRFSNGILDGRENDIESQANDTNGEFEPGERGNATGIESVGSSEIDTEDELEAVRRENAKRVLYPVSPEHRPSLHAGDGGESSGSDQSRPRLEGGSSDEQDATLPASPRQEMSLRQSAEGEVVCSPVPGDGGGGGDGMSDGETSSSLTAPSVVSSGAVGRPDSGNRRVFFRSWSSQSGHSDQERNVEGSVFRDPQQTPTPEMSRLAPHFLLPSMPPQAAGSMNDLQQSPEPRPLSGASSFHFEEGAFDSSQEGLHQRFWNSGMLEGDGREEDGRGNGTEEEQDADKTLIGATGNRWDASWGGKGGDIDTEGDILQIQQMMDDFGHAPTPSSGNSVRVYNPFDGVQKDLQGASFQGEDLSAFEGEFIAQDDAEAFLEEDQKEFEREHQFREDEYISSDQFCNHSASRWTPPDKSHVTLDSPGVNGDECFGERVSLGEFIRTRTEALGSLSGEHGIKRVSSKLPSFGTGHIKTPENKEPVALVEMSRLSLVSEEPGSDTERVQGILGMEDLGESIRFAGVGSDTEDQHKPRNKSARLQAPQQAEDSSSSFAELDGYLAGKDSLPMASLYFRAADPEGSSADNHLHQQRMPTQNTSGDPQMATLNMRDLSLPDESDVDSDSESRGVSKFIRKEDDVNYTPVAETPDVSQTTPSTLPSKPNLKVQPFQEAMPAIPRHLKEESEPDGTRTPPIATSSIAAAIVNASSCTKPEEFAAMIVALSNKNRKPQKGPTAKPKEEPVNRFKSADALRNHPNSKSPSQQRNNTRAVPFNKQESHSESPSLNSAEVPGTAMTLPNSNKSRSTGDSQQWSEGTHGRTQPSGLDSELSLPRKFPANNSTSYKSMQASRSPAQKEIQDEKPGNNAAPRSGSSSPRGVAARNQTSRGNVKGRREASPVEQSGSSSLLSTSAKQKAPRRESSPKESVDSSVMKELVGMELSFDSRMKVHVERVKMIQKAQEAQGGTVQASRDSLESLDSDTLLCTPRSPMEGHRRYQNKPLGDPENRNVNARKLPSDKQKDLKYRTERGLGRRPESIRVSPSADRSRDVLSVTREKCQGSDKFGIYNQEDLSQESDNFTDIPGKKRSVKAARECENLNFQELQGEGNKEQDMQCGQTQRGFLKEGSSPKNNDVEMRGSRQVRSVVNGNTQKRDFSSDDENDNIPRVQSSGNEHQSSRQPSFESSEWKPVKLRHLQRRDPPTNLGSGGTLKNIGEKLPSPASKQLEKCKDDHAQNKTQNTHSPDRESNRFSASPNTTPTAKKSPASLYSASSSLSESSTQTSYDDTINTSFAKEPELPASQPYGPPITSFQAFPKAPRVVTCVSSTTPTLLTSQSLLTDALLKQYLNEQAVTTRPLNTLSVAPSYVSGQLIKTLDAVQKGASVAPTLVSVSAAPHIAPLSSNFSLTQALPPLTINTGQDTPSLNQLQHQDPSFPPNPVVGTHALLTSTRDLGPMLERVSIPGQGLHLDNGVPFVPPYPTSATMPVVPIQSAHSVPPSAHGLSATSFATLPTFHGATTSGYPVGTISNRPGSAQEHVPPQPTRVNAPSINPVVVSSINIKGVCCLGIAKQAVLPLQNPGPRWLQCHLEVVSVSLNGEELPTGSLSSFLVKRRTIISPQNSEDVKVVFVPHQPGIYVAQVLVSSSPVVADGEVAYLSQGVPVTILARAEKPIIGVKGAQNGTLDLGILSYGKERSAPIYLINQGCSTVPLRLLIKVNSSAWHSFYLHTGDSKSIPDSVSGLNLPSHVTLDGQNDTATLWVHFRASQRDKAGSPGSLAAPEQVSAKLEVWLDVPEGGSLPITSVILRATVGLAKLNIPRALSKEITLRSSQGEHTGRRLPLKNTGNIHLDIELNVMSAQGLFSVVPQTILLAPGQEVDVLIKYTPKDVPSFDTGQLTMCARPDGPSYEVMLRGEAVEKSLDSTKPHILVNRHYISWGGVPIGRALQQKLTIRSCSKTEKLRLKLHITESKQDFQLLNTFKTGEWSTEDSQYVTLRPLEDIPVHVLFSPTAVSTSQAKLNIKPQGSNFKYSVPLSGYGGVSKLIVENAREIEHGCYSLSVGQVNTKHHTVCHITVSNIGRRSAFVKALGFQDMEGKDKLLSSQLHVEPAEFIVQEKTQRTLTITLPANSLETEKRPGNTEGFLAGLGLFYGDEISRQQHRRALRHKDSDAVSLSEHNPLRGISFDQPIPGEAKVNEVCDLPWRSGDLNLFYRCISRLMIHLKGHLLNPSAALNQLATGSVSPVKKSEGFTTGTNSGVGSADQSNRPVMAPYTPPVKGTPARCPAATTAQHTIHPLSSTQPSIGSLPSSAGQANEGRADSWSVQPQQLVLTVPGADLGVQRSHSIRLANHTVRHLRFETMHNPDCLIVTPAAGVVEPSRQLFILVSCNVSIRSKGVELPWSGVILVVCDGQQQEVKVQIREDFGMDSSMLPPLRRMQSIPDQPVTPTTSIASPVTDTMSPVKLLSKVVQFPSTKVASTSAATLEFQNKTLLPRQWCLSSFAPTYVKQASGEVYRATYSAFRFTHQSGNLEPGQNITVHLEFIPRDEGAYSQYWDLESSNKGVVAKNSHTTRIELMGQGIGDVAPPLHRPKKKKKGTAEETLVRVRPQVALKQGTPAQHGKGDTASEGDVSPEDARTQEERQNRSPDSKSVQGVLLIHDHLIFSKTRVGSTTTLKVQVQNKSQQAHTVKFVSPQPPFFIRHHQHTIQSKRFIHLPVSFKPTAPGKHQAALVIKTEGHHNLLSRLEGTAE